MKKTLLEVVLVAFPKVLGGALTLVLSVVLLRFLEPEAYGLYSLSVATILLIDAVIGSSIDTGVLRLATAHRVRQPERTRAVEHAALQFKVVVGIAMTAVVAGLSEPISAALFHDVEHAPLVVATALATLALVALRTALVHAQVEQRFTQYGLLELVHNAVKFAGIAAVLALVPVVRPIHVVAWFALAPAATLLLAVTLQRRDGPWTVRSSRKESSELLGFVKWYAATGILGTIINRMDVLLLTAFGTLVDVGIFSGAHVFALIPSLLGSYLAIVIAPRIVPRYSAAGFRRFFLRAQVSLYAAAALGLVVALLGASDLLRFLIPVAYRDSIGLVLVLLPGALVSFTTIPVALSLVLFFRRKFLLFVDCVVFPILCVSYYFAIRAHGAYGAAVVTTASLLVRGATAQYAAWKLTRDETNAASEDDELPAELHSTGEALASGEFR